MRNGLTLLVLAMVLGAAPGQALARPTDSLVKDEVAGIHLGESLTQVLAVLKRQGYALQAPLSVSCVEALYNGVTIKPCRLSDISLKKRDDQGVNDIQVEATPSTSERMDYAIQEAFVWRISLQVELSDRNQATQERFTSMVEARYPDLRTLTSSDLSAYTGCELSGFNLNFPRGRIAITPADTILPINDGPTVHCAGILAGIVPSPGFQNIPDSQALSIVFFDNELRDRITRTNDDLMRGWATQDAGRPVAPRF